MKMTNNIEFVTGDMFRTSMQTIVITVNCKGVMGKGIALYVKKKVFPAYEEYRKKCESGEITIGKLDIFDKEIEELNSIDGYKKLLFFPTKIHWKQKSDLLGIRQGLEWFVAHYKEMGIDSAAFPALGCGNGGLSWTGVRPLMTEYLDKLDIPIEVYSPVDNSEFESLSSNKQHQKIKSSKLTDF